MLDPKITIECGKCGRKREEPLSRLKNNARIRCPSCGTTTVVKGDGAEKTAAALKSAADAFSKIGRKR